MVCRAVIKEFDFVSWYLVHAPALQRTQTTLASSALTPADVAASVQQLQRTSILCSSLVKGQLKQVNNPSPTKVPGWLAGWLALSLTHLCPTIGLCELSVTLDYVLARPGNDPLWALMTQKQKVSFSISLLHLTSFQDCVAGGKVQ